MTIATRRGIWASACGWALAVWTTMGHGAVLEPVASGYASISNLRFTVVDLDLSDGVEAGFAWTYQEPWVPGTSYTVTPSDGSQVQHSLPGTWAPSAFGYDQSGLSYAGVFSQSATGWDASSLLQMKAPVAGGYEKASAQALTAPYFVLWSYNLLLNPNTMVEFTFELSAVVTLDQSAGTGGFAYASAAVFDYSALTESDPGWGSRVSACKAFGQLASGVDATCGQIDGLDAQVSGRLSFSSGDNYRGVQLAAFTEAQLEYVSAAVPEVEQRTLLLIGLAALALLGRSRFLRTH